jgi:hypothetical protein
MIAIEDDETRERALFAQRVEAGPPPHGMKLGVADVFERIDRRAPAARNATASRLLTHGANVLVAAAACWALVRGLPAQTAVEGIEPSAALREDATSAPQDRTARGGSTDVSSGQSQAASGTLSGVDSMCEAPPSESSRTASDFVSDDVEPASSELVDGVGAESLPATMMTSWTAACEPRSCGEEVTCEAVRP